MGGYSKRAVVPTYPIDAFTENCENVFMFLREKYGRKMKKRTVPHVHEDTYWSVVENRRVSEGCVVQRQVLYLV